jgi:nicotinate-nucleotide adenylyltransferase
LTVTDADLLAPKTIHARTAAAKIAVDFPAFADPTVTEAVRWHTTGHAGMTLTEKLLYLADYIDESRTFESCVILRRYFWGADPESMSQERREALLRKTLILSYDMTVRDLIGEGKPVATDTVEARNELLLEEAKS